MFIIYRDTAGQERFESITTSFYHGAIGILLVYDITKVNTFKNIVRWIDKVNKVICNFVCL